jgi:EmrB/QacA subfamily drug resistance transporter
MTTELLTPRGAGRLPQLYRWAPLPVILAGTFMVVLDFFIVNVALPSMQSHLHASSSALEWVVAGYAVTSAVFLMTAGRLGDRFGRRRVFSVGLELFTVSSAVCGIAPTATILIAGRVVQGVAGALLMPNVLSLIGALYEGDDRAQALSAYGMTMGLAAAGGQLIGGALVALDPAGLSWRTCFLINVPVGVLALIAAPRLVPESKAEHGSGLDPLGTILATTGLTAIVLPLVEGRAHGWPAWTLISLGLAPVILAAFVLHQRRLHRKGATPLVELRLFAARSFSAGLLAQLVFWCGQASFFLVLALYLQQGRGLGPMTAGLVFTILAVSYLAASAGAPALTLRHGRRVLAAGAVTLATGHVLLLATVADLGTTGPTLALAPALLLIGAGMGLAIAPLATIILATIPGEQAGSASGLLATMQNVGNALGVALIGVIFFGAVHHGISHALELSLGALALIVLGVAVITRLLPAPETVR